jgi:hypothetical protein
MKYSAYFCDLTHQTAQGVLNKCYPLGISYVMSYVKKNFGEILTTRLFKYPKDFKIALQDKVPDFLFFSNYSWNSNLAYSFAEIIKEKHPRVTVVFGGPNFPVNELERKDYLADHSAIDFYIYNEGELGAVELIRDLIENNLDINQIYKTGKPTSNCCFLHDGKLSTGTHQRVEDLDSIPSPYLSGLMDSFLKDPLIPLVESTRGCPFSCTFCMDGQDSKSRKFEFSTSRFKEEINFIASNQKNGAELIISDLNFGMYKRDIELGKIIAEVQEKYNWPKLLGVSTGKNKPERVIEIAKIVNGMYVGASVQSIDSGVLSAIKRENISTDKILALTEIGKTNDQLTFSEVILGLPNDSVKSHFHSLKTVVDMGVERTLMYQAILLNGTEMSGIETRKAYSIDSMFRLLPGYVGQYECLGEKFVSAESEEIIISTNTLSFDDYLKCRVMHLAIEIFANNGFFEEVINILPKLGLSIFDGLEYLVVHHGKYSSVMENLIEGFLEESKCDLWKTRSELLNFVKTPKNLNKYLDGELGVNELFNYRVIALIKNFEQINNIVFSGLSDFINSNGKRTKTIEEYLIQLQKYNLYRKNSFLDSELNFQDEFSFNFSLSEQNQLLSDPDSFDILQNFKINFTHSGEQKDYIKNSLNIYEDNLLGLGRLLQRCRIKNMFREAAIEPIPIMLKPV